MDIAAITTDETATLRALRAGDEETFRRLVHEYHGRPLIRVAQVYVSSRSVAEEVVQETWLGVFKGLDRFEGRSSLKTWIFTILTNTAKTRGQREGRTIPMSALQNPALVPEPSVDPARFRPDGDQSWPAHWASPPPEWDLPETRLLASEMRQRLLAAVDDLPASQRAVISLHDVHGWSSDEVCNALGVSETNQRVLLHRARSKVRRSLEEYLTTEHAG